jgi:hypothetical protein
LRKAGAAAAVEEEVVVVVVLVLVLVEQVLVVPVEVLARAVLPAQAAAVRALLPIRQ